jgi:hypothetical protein
MAVIVYFAFYATVVLIGANEIIKDIRKNEKSKHV